MVSLKLVVFGASLIQFGPQGGQVPNQQLQYYQQQQFSQQQLYQQQQSTEQTFRDQRNNAQQQLYGR